MVFSSWSSELPEDSVVALGDLLTQEVAQCFAVKEDQCLFLGDGTSTYGGIVGLANALAAGAYAQTATNIDTPAEITIASFEEAMGKLLMLPGIQPKWYCHSSIYYNVLQRLANAQAVMWPTTQPAWAQSSWAIRLCSAKEWTAAHRRLTCPASSSPTLAT